MQDISSFDTTMDWVIGADDYSLNFLFYFWGNNNWDVQNGLFTDSTGAEQSTQDSTLIRDGGSP